MDIFSSSCQWEEELVAFDAAPDYADKLTAVFALRTGSPLQVGITSHSA
jgi:hypothetical protein